jgi:hypothetical protein
MDIPASTLLPPPSTTNNPSFLVQWTETDGSSSIASYDIYITQDRE